MKKILYLTLLITISCFAQNKFLDRPLVSEIFTADPSAHLFEGKIYVYPSHDIIEKNPMYDDCGSQYAMRDYRVLSMDYIGGPVTIHDVALDLNDVTWAKRQFWAPDAAEKDGKYYLYFPTKDKQDIFKIGVAISSNPAGPFKPEKNPIKGSYSMDPSVFKDDDGSYYMYFGGIWGGQLQRWDENNNYTESGCETQDNGIPNSPAISPRIALMSDDMLNFAEEPKPIRIIDKNGDPILTKDHDRRFFEAAWIHKKDGIYYLSYSTGNTHYIVYATSDNPYGPFVYQGIMNNPVQGWTNHHSTLEVDNKWYFFYHDTQISGKDFLRNVKVTEMFHDSNGKIKTINTIKN